MVVLSSLPPPTEGIRWKQTSTSAHINSREIGKGTLYIAESCVSWVKDVNGEGFSLEYPHVALHAVSRDLSAYPQECLYLMLDVQLDQSQPKPEAGDGDGEDSDPEPELTEIRFIPDDKGMLDAMFHAMSECQALHPDPQDSLSEDEDDLFGEDEGEYEIGPEEGDAERNGEEMDGVEEETGQFDDAEVDH